MRDLPDDPAIAADTKISPDAIKVSVLALVLFEIAPDTVMSLPAATVCNVVAPLKLLKLTVNAAVVLRISALLVIVTDVMLLLVFSAVTAAPFTKMTV